MDTYYKDKHPSLPTVCLRKHSLLLTVLGLLVFTRILFSFHHHGTENQFDETDTRLECGYCLAAHAAMDLDTGAQAIAVPPYSSNSYELPSSQTPHSISISAASARAPPHS